MTARPVKRRTAMERLDTAVEQYALDYDPPSRRAYRRAVRALLRERAEQAEWAYVQAAGEMGGSSDVVQSIRAAVLKGKP